WDNEITFRLPAKVWPTASFSKMVSFTLTRAAAWSPSVNTSSRATCVPPGAAGAAAPAPPGVVVVDEPAGLAPEASGLKGSLVAKAWKVSTAAAPGGVV